MPNNPRQLRYAEQRPFSDSEYARQSLAFSCDIAASYAEQPAPTTLRRTEVKKIN